MLGDADKTVASRYGVLSPRGMANRWTFYIDKSGRVHWGRHGGGPFTDYEFLVSQLQRMNAMQTPAATSSPAAPR